MTNVFTIIGDTSGRVAKGQGDVTSGTIYLRLVDLAQRQRKWYDPQFWIQGILSRPEPQPERYFSQFDIQRDARQIMEELPRAAIGRAGRLAVSAAPASARP